MNKASKQMKYYQTLCIQLFFICGLLLFSFELEAKTDSLEQKLTETSNHREKVNLLIEIAGENTVTDPQKSLEFTSEAYKIAHKNNYKELSARTMLLLGKHYINLKNIDSAHYFYQNALNYYTEKDDLYEMTECFNGLGHCYYFKNKHFKAIENYNKVVSIFEKQGKTREAISARRRIGIVYWQIYDHSKALKIFMKSAEEAKKLEDNNLLGLIYVNTASVFKSKNDFKTAKNYLTQAIECFESTDNQDDLLDAKVSLAKLYASNEEFEKAIPLLEEKIENSMKTNNIYSEVFEKINLGIMYHQSGNSQKATELLLEIEPKVIDFGLDRELAYLKINLAQIFADVGNNNMAATYAKKASQLGKMINGFWIISQSHLILSKLDSVDGHFKSSLTNYKIYKTYNDSVMTKSNRDEINKLEIRFQTKEKEKENLLLQKEVEMQEITIRQKDELIFSYTLAFIITVVLLIVILILYRQKLKALRKIVEENLKSLKIESENEREISFKPLLENVSTEDDKVIVLKQKFEKFMVEEKPYLWSEVNLDEFVQKLNTNRTYLSRLINNEFGTSFYDLLCEYRIRAARKLLADESKKHLSVEGIGETCGFKSNSTFHSKFKTLVGVTPNSFRQEAVKSKTYNKTKV